MNKREKLAWVAGIIDGEGTITLIRNKGYNIVPRVIVCMTTKQTIYRVYNILRLGHVRKAHFTNSPNHKWKYWFQANGTYAIKIIKLVYPFLFLKKPQAKLCLQYKRNCMFGVGAYYRLPKSQQKIRTKFVKIIRKLNRKGP